MNRIYLIFLLLPFCMGATLTWNYDPSLDEANHDGFRVYYGKMSHAVTDPVDMVSASPYETRVEIDNPDVRSVALPLDADLYYIRMTTYGLVEGQPDDSSFSSELVADLRPTSTEIEYSRVQSAGSPYADPAAATLAATPTQGNLIVVAAMERSGVGSTAFTISGSGWTRQITETVLQSDTTYRRSIAVWWKIADASEPTTITVDNGTTNLKLISVQEFSAGVSDAEWAMEQALSSDNGAVTGGTSLSTGLTSSIADGKILKLGFGFIKRMVSTDSWSATMTNGLDSLANHGNSVAFGSQIVSGFDPNDEVSGIKGATVQWSGTDIGTNTGLLTAFMVFRATISDITIINPPSNVSTIVSP